MKSERSFLARMELKRNALSFNWRDIKQGAALNSTQMVVESVPMEVLLVKAMSSLQRDQVILTPRSVRDTRSNPIRPMESLQKEVVPTLEPNVVPFTVDVPTNTSKSSSVRTSVLLVADDEEISREVKTVDKPNICFPCSRNLRLPISILILDFTTRLGASVTTTRAIKCNWRMNSTVHSVPMVKTLRRASTIPSIMKRPHWWTSMESTTTDAPVPKWPTLLGMSPVTFGAVTRILKLPDNSVVQHLV